MSALPPDPSAMAQPPEATAMVAIDVEDVRDELLRAIRAAALAGASAGVAQAQDDAAKAALNFSQAFVLLDPMIDASTGVDVGMQNQHEVRMAQIDGENQQAVAKHRSAAAPTPVKGLRRRRTGKITRDQHGRAQGFDVTDEES